MTQPDCCQQARNSFIYWDPTISEWVWGEYMARTPVRYCPWCGDPFKSVQEEES